MYTIDAKMIDEPSAVGASTRSPKRKYASTATNGSCRKLIGDSAETSASWSARAHASCETVPIAPASATKHQPCHAGHDQTQAAGSSESGVHIASVYSTIAAEDSVRDNTLMLTDTPALSTAEHTAASAPSVSVPAPGRITISTPAKPIATALQR